MPGACSKLHPTFYPPDAVVVKDCLRTALRVVPFLTRGVLGAIWPEESIGRGGARTAGSGQRAEKTVVRAQFPKNRNICRGSAGLEEGKFFGELVRSLP